MKNLVIVSPPQCRNVGTSSVLLLAMACTGPLASQSLTRIPQITPRRSIVAASSLADGGAVSWATTTPNGGLVLARPSQGELVLLAANGAVLARVGRKGSGPREFTRLGPFGWNHDTLWVFDAANRRTTYFSSALAFLRTEAFPLGTMRSGPRGTESWSFVAPRADRGPAGWIIDGQSLPVGSGRTNTGGSEGLLELDGSGNLTRVLFRSPDDKCAIRTSVAGTPVHIRNPLCTPPTTAMGTEGDYFAVLLPSLGSGSQSTVSIDRYSPSGNLVWRKTIEFAASRVSRSAKDSILKAFDRPELPAGVAAVAKDLPFPRSMPVVAGLMVGRGGILLIERNAAGASPEWLLLSQSGSILGTLRIRTGERVVAAAETVVWALGESASGNQELVRYDI